MYKKTEEHKKKIGLAHKGVKHTPEAIEKIKGRPISEKVRKVFSKNWGNGEKCHLWRGGISFEPYSVDWTKTLRKSIRQRDRYTCQVCGKEPAICVHHIDYNKKNCSPNNLITLCKSCHSKTQKNRKYWTNYFIKD